MSVSKMWSYAPHARSNIPYGFHDGVLRITATLMQHPELKAYLTDAKT